MRTRLLSSRVINKCSNGSIFISARNQCRERARIDEFFAGNPSKPSLQCTCRVSAMPIASLNLVGVKIQRRALWKRERRREKRYSIEREREILNNVRLLLFELIWRFNFNENDTVNYFFKKMCTNVTKICKKN